MVDRNHRFSEVLSNITMESAIAPETHSHHWGIWGCGEGEVSGAALAVMVQFLGCSKATPSRWRLQPAHSRYRGECILQIMGERGPANRHHPGRRS